jgi:hypothetical protein
VKGSLYVTTTVALPADSLTVAPVTVIVGGGSSSMITREPAGLVTLAFTALVTSMLQRIGHP